MNELLEKLKLAPWKTFVALGLMYASLYFQWYWVWGILFLMWTIQSVRTNETYLVEEITRDEHPVVFWLIIATWMVVSVLMILIDALALL